jgi:enoyl-CoA hydratase/carnithine racemase
MNYEQILYAAREGVATLTLNRPQKLNAWTHRMAAELREAMRRADADDAVRVIVLTGAGRGFCSGADMALLGEIGAGATGDDGVPRLPPYDPASRPDFHGPFSWFPAVSKPILCAVNGVAAGLGFVYPLYCDIRFAGSEAFFLSGFSRRGAVAEHGCAWLLSKLVGMANAFDLMYSGRRVGADEALRMGLVNRVIDGPALMDETMAYARMLASEVSPRALRVMKRQIWDAQFRTLGEDVAVSLAEMALSFRSEDFREGVAHFVEKRPPAFTGR